MTLPRRTPYSRLSRPCPRCGAEVGQRCRSVRGGGPLANPHAARDPSRPPNHVIRQHECPRCHAPVGAACHGPTNQAFLGVFHAARVLAAEAADAVRPAISPPVTSEVLPPEPPTSARLLEYLAAAEAGLRAVTADRDRLAALVSDLRVAHAAAQARADALYSEVLARRGEVTRAP